MRKRRRSNKIHNDNGQEDIKRSREAKKLKDLEKFVKKNFKQAECRFFSIGKDNACHCGEKKENHAKDDKKYVLPVWDSVKSIEKKSSETFGKIAFVGENIMTKVLTDYVRLSYEDDIEKVFVLLDKHWSIKMGKLAISVIGGAKNFSMPKKDKDVFSNGLIKATQTTNALIITAGLNLGITKVVGQAVQEGETFLFDKKKHNNPICCLGITPWGYVLNRNELADKNEKTVEYKVSNEIKIKQPVSLNENHTHYLFVDEGRRNNFGGTKAGEFRARFEHHMTTEKNMSVVLVIVEGGYDVFHEASRSVKQEIPIVICEGTGRSADVLGEAYRERTKNKDDIDFKFSDTFKNSLKSKLNNIQNNCNFDEVWNYIETIMQKESLITTFNMKTSEDLDIAILYSLIKKMKNDENKESLFNQIMLCLTWNRVDIARDKIFTDEIKLESKNWNELLKQSIIAGKVEFIQLFLNNGAPITDFLNLDSLEMLYKESERRYYFDKTAQFYLKVRPYKNINDVNEILDHMMGHYNIKVYEKAEDFKTKEASPEEAKAIDAKKVLKKPYNDLFIWSVLMERHECAKVFWERCKDATFMAILATKMYLMQKNSAKIQETERKRELNLWKDYFEDMAIKVIEEFHDIDPTYAEQLINIPMEKWGGMTCLELAFKSKDEKFISSIACQNSIDKKWYNGIRLSLFSCTVGIFLPCAVLQKKDINKGMDQEWVQERPKENSIDKHEISDNAQLHNTKEADVDFKNSSRCTPVSYLTIQQFYTAPQTKFVMHLLLNLAFVIYNSIVILYLMRRDNLINPHELIFIIYHICFIIDRFIEMITFNEKPLKYRPRDWLNASFWRVLDIIIVITCFTGIVLAIVRIGTSGQTLIYVYRAAKTFYSFTVGFFYLRFLRLLTVNYTLGPKMVIIMKMLLELIQYLLITAIILISYGVTSQATYYTERTFSLDRLLEILAYPYWSLFGELSLDETVYFAKCNMSVATNDDGGCPEYNFVIPILYALYIFIGNILLLNVLIAIFSHLFQEIHHKSIHEGLIWKFNMYSLVLEYETKALLPPPFSLFVYIIEGFIYVHSRRSQESNKPMLPRNNKVYDKENTLKRGISSKSVETTSSEHANNENENDNNECDVNENDNIKMNLLEVNCQKLVINNKRKQEQRSVENYVYKMSKELKTLGTSVSTINENVTNMAINGKCMAYTSFDSLPKKSQISTETTDLTSSSNSVNSALELNQLRLELKTWHDDDGSNIRKFYKKVTKKVNTIETKLEEQSHRMNELDHKLETYQNNTISALKTIESVLQDIMMK